MRDKDLITIKQAAQVLGVSQDTLRRWDRNDKLPAVRSKSRGYRYYYKNQLAELMPALNMFRIVLKWAGDNSAREPLPDFYCPNSSIFQARLAKFEAELIGSGKLKDKFSLIVAIAGEIGNNAYDHNLGNWPDLPGAFFIYNIDKGIIVIADRGQGVLTTLKKARPDLKDDQEALKVAFIEIISGRAPESRGNGLKFVRNIVMENNFELLFVSGRAELKIKQGENKLDIRPARTPIPGCLALIKF